VADVGHVVVGGPGQVLAGLGGEHLGQGSHATEGGELGGDLGEEALRDGVAAGGASAHALGPELVI
jgi:hypothetical protein